MYRCIRGIEEGVYNGWGNIRYNGYCSGNIPREYPREWRHGTRTSVRTSHQGYKAYTGHQKSNDYEHLDPCMPACIPPNVCTTVRLVSTTAFYGAARPSTVRRGAARRGIQANSRGKRYSLPDLATRRTHGEILRTTVKHPTQFVGYYRILPEYYPNIRPSLRLRDRISFS